MGFGHVHRSGAGGGAGGFIVAAAVVTFIVMPVLQGKDPLAALNLPLFHAAKRRIVQQVNIPAGVEAIRGVKEISEDFYADRSKYVQDDGDSAPMQLLTAPQPQEETYYADSQAYSNAARINRRHGVSNGT